MGQITSIKPQKRKTRFNIFVDGKFAFGLDADLLVGSGLKVEQEISQEEIDKLVRENEFHKVYDRVINFLSYRPRSVKEIQDWFFRKEVGEEVKKQILPKLTKLGYLNDEEFANWWIEQRKTFRPAGKNLLRLELRKKGISQEIINQQFSNLTIEQFDERKLAKKILEKKRKILKGFPVLEQKQKLSAHLARRGFSWQVIKEAVDDYLKKG